MPQVSFLLCIAGSVDIDKRFLDREDEKARIAFYGRDFFISKH